MGVQAEPLHVQQGWARHLLHRGVPPFPFSESLSFYRRSSAVLVILRTGTGCSTCWKGTEPLAPRQTMLQEVAEAEGGAYSANIAVASFA